MLEIFVANTAEAFATLLDKVGAESDRAKHEIDLAGRALLWGGTEKIVITSNPIDPVLVKVTARLLRISRLEVWHPRQSSLRLCFDILQDVDLVERLRNETDGRAPFLVLPYAVTPEFCELSERMGWGVYREALAAATELDSKAGFRRLFANSQLTLPNGCICHDVKDTASAVLALESRGLRAVVKVHNGESGWGLRILDPPDDHPRALSDTIIAIRALFESDPVWDSGPYIVEEFIRHDRHGRGFSPSGEATVDTSGVRFDFLCDQCISSDGEFNGVIIGSDVERSPQAAEIRRQTLIVGEALRLRSYRGTYDVDFIVDLNGEIHAVECNIRLTGGTHVIGAARQLFGDRWRDMSFVSDDAIHYAGEPRPVAEILQLLDPLLCKEGSKEGVIVSFLSTSRAIIGLIGISTGRDGAIHQLDLARRRLQGDRTDLPRADA